MLKIRLQEVAIEKKISMAQVAKRSGLDYKTVQRIWNDPYKNVDTLTIARLCKGLSVGPGELLEYIGDDTAEG
ncbi:MAG: hypothetical protein PVS3B3_11430 [Ktedonobacteraceae bacterium]